MYYLPYSMQFQMQLMYSKAKELVCIRNKLFSFFAFLLKIITLGQLSHVYEKFKFTLDVNVSALWS